MGDQSLRARKKTTSLSHHYYVTYLFQVKNDRTNCEIVPCSSLLDSFVLSWRIRWTLKGVWGYKVVKGSEDQYFAWLWAERAPYAEKSVIDLRKREYK